MNRRNTLLALLALLGAPIARAQQTQKMHRVGWIVATGPTVAMIGPEPTNPNARVLLRELRALGYVEGKNFIFDPVSAEGHPERYPELVAEMLRRKPDVLMVSGSQVAVAAKKATTTVPIVMASVAQPVKYGLIESFARPGGNVTGLTADVTPETEAKRLELLKALVPKLSRVSCLATKWIWEGPIGQAARQVAPALAITLLYAEHKPDDLKTTFANIVSQRPEALLVALSPDVMGQRQQLAEFAINARLPAIFPFAAMVEAGGLMSYGYDSAFLYRQAARYVDKILRGAKPGELPVEQPAVYELVINLKTAKALGLTVSKELLFRANKVIE